jgi:hypothetical protein
MGMNLTPFPKLAANEEASDYSSDEPLSENDDDFSYEAVAKWAKRNDAGNAGSDSDDIDLSDDDFSFEAVQKWKSKTLNRMKRAVPRSEAETPVATEEEAPDAEQSNDGSEGESESQQPGTSIIVAAGENGSPAPAPTEDTAMETRPVLQTHNTGQIKEMVEQETKDAFHNAEIVHAGAVEKHHQQHDKLQMRLKRKQKEKEKMERAVVERGDAIDLEAKHAFENAEIVQADAIEKKERQHARLEKRLKEKGQKHKAPVEQPQADHFNDQVDRETEEAFHNAEIVQNNAAKQQHDQHDRLQQRLKDKSNDRRKNEARVVQMGEAIDAGTSEAYTNAEIVQSGILDHQHDQHDKLQKRLQQKADHKRRQENQGKKLEAVVDEGASGAIQNTDVVKSDAVNQQHDRLQKRLGQKATAKQNSDAQEEAEATAAAEDEQQTGEMPKEGQDNGAVVPVEDALEEMPADDVAGAGRGKRAGQASEAFQNAVTMQANILHQLHAHHEQLQQQGEAHPAASNQVEGIAEPASTSPAGTRTRRERALAPTLPTPSIPQARQPTSQLALLKRKQRKRMYQKIKLKKLSRTTRSKQSARASSAGTESSDTIAELKVQVGTLESALKRAEQGRRNAIKVASIARAFSTPGQAVGKDAMAQMHQSVNAIEDSAIPAAAKKKRKLLPLTGARGIVHPHEYVHNASTAEMPASHLVPGATHNATAYLRLPIMADGVFTGKLGILFPGQQLKVAEALGKWFRLEEPFCGSWVRSSNPHGTHGLWVAKVNGEVPEHLDDMQESVISSTVTAVKTLEEKLTYLEEDSTRLKTGIDVAKNVLEVPSKYESGSGVEALHALQDGNVVEEAPQDIALGNEEDETPGDDEAFLSSIGDLWLSKAEKKLWKTSPSIMKVEPSKKKVPLLSLEYGPRESPTKRSPASLGWTKRPFSSTLPVLPAPVANSPVGKEKVSTAVERLMSEVCVALNKASKPSPAVHHVVLPKIRVGFSNTNGTTLPLFVKITLCKDFVTDVENGCIVCAVVVENGEKCPETTVGPGVYVIEAFVGKAKYQKVAIVDPSKQEMDGRTIGIHFVLN